MQRQLPLQLELPCCLRNRARAMGGSAAGPGAMRRSAAHYAIALLLCRALGELQYLLLALQTDTPR